MVRRPILSAALAFAVLAGCGGAPATGPPAPISSTSATHGPSTQLTTSSAASPSSTSSSPSAAPAPSPVTSGEPVTSATLSPAAESAPPPALEPASTFTSAVSAIDETLAARMSASWRPGCPVALADLRHLGVTYRGFDGADHQGELVVAASVADDVTGVFRQLYDNGYPIASMRLVDDFGASDDASMAADNTSAFNCRAVTGGSGWSEHSYGTAIDLNPVENPYVSGGTVLPPSGAAYRDRPDVPGVIQAGDATVAAFESIGWSWGGYWSRPTDYQHFSQSGR